MNRINESNIHEEEKLTSKKAREIRKKLYNENRDFYKLVFINWANLPQNKSQIDNFFSSLKISFDRVAVFHNLNHNIWQ